MRWNDRNSEYARERRCEEEELRRKVDIKGISDWDMACFGAGGEEKLLREIGIKKQIHLLEIVEKKINSLKFANSWAKEDPAPFIKNLMDYYRDHKEKKEKCYYTCRKSDGSIHEIIFLYDKFSKMTESSWYDYDISNSKRCLYRISRARRGIYDLLLLRFYKLRDKSLEEIKILDCPF